MFGARISKREIERLARRLEELRGLQKQLGVLDVEMLAALVSFSDYQRVRRRLRRDQGEDDDDGDEED